VIALELSLRTVLAVVFGAAAVSKLSSRRSFAEFARSLSDIGWLSDRGRRAAAAAVPVAEVTTLVLVLVPSTMFWGFAAGTALLAAFTSVAASEMRRGSGLRCRCFGSGGGLIGPAQIARNIVLIAVSVAGLAMAPVSHGGLSAAGIVLAVGLALIAGAVLVRWDDLSKLVQTS
jgi:methylamine utilization protein MauE